MIQFELFTEAEMEEYMSLLSTLAEVQEYEEWQYPF